MPKLAADTLRVVDRYWAALLGCPPEHFASRDTLVVAHTGLGEFPGVYCFVRNESLLASVPADRLDALRPALAPLRAADAINLPRLAAALGELGEVVGPAFIGYADRGTYRPTATPGVRLLDENDRHALKALRKACTDQDWEYGGSDLGERPLAGQFSDNVLTAVAGYAEWAGDIAHISVVSHPDFRGLGYGKGVVSAITEVALTRALVPQYRTLAANDASRAIAQGLGFVEYATSVAVKDQSPATA